MSTDGNIFVYQRDAFDGGAPSLSTGTNAHVIETNDTVPIDLIIGQITQVRQGVFRDREHVKITILAHGITESDGRFWIQLGTGLNTDNIRVVEPIALLQLEKIVCRACGPIDESGETGRPAGYDSMVRLYSSLSHFANTPVIAGEENQRHHITISPDRTIRTMPWVGTRFEYLPDGSRRGILPV
jgi:hypothetical protein